MTYEPGLRQEFQWGDLPERTDHGSAYQAQSSTSGESHSDQALVAAGGRQKTSADSLTCRRRTGRYIIRSCPIGRTERNCFQSMGWVRCFVSFARSTWLSTDFQRNRWQPAQTGTKEAQNNVRGSQSGLLREKLALEENDCIQLAFWSWIYAFW